jgi:hypothetical protein
LLFRKATDGESRPVAVPSWRRSEVLRAEAPIDAAATLLSGRLLDRQGHPLAVPVRVSERQDENSGGRWLVAELTLAPLAAGEYVLALGSATEAEHTEVLTAFRVVR